MKAKQVPCGNDNKKGKGKCCDLSTALRSGRDDRVWGAGGGNKADSCGMTTNRAKARAEVLMGYSGRSAALACGSDRVFCWDEFSICPVF
jgi:hypothetical protein